MLADVSGHDYWFQCHQPGNSQDVYKARQAAHWNSKKLLSYGNLLVPQAHDAAKSTPVTVN